jgi:hypothetical protein
MRTFFFSYSGGGGEDDKKALTQEEERLTQADAIALELMQVTYADVR